jgi:hypothetical protein
MDKVKRLPLPAWYDPKLIGNPFFQPNPIMIRDEAYRIAKENAVQPVTADNFRVLVIDVDLQNDFTWIFTTIDPHTGIVSRHLAPVFEGRPGVEIPDWWKEGQNRFLWMDKDFNPGKFVSVVGGRLSVAGAWNDTRRQAEWDLANTHLITKRVASFDKHPLTMRCDTHFYEARANNPYGLPVGAHPHSFMDGPGEMFPKITTQSLWHPRNNRIGWWKPLALNERDMDEIWYYVNFVKEIFLWDMHCHAQTGGATMDPVVMATIMHHHFMRGRLAAEPVWIEKGKSWRVDALGMHKPEYAITGDPLTQAAANIVDMIDGTPDCGMKPYDLVVYRGQAKSHCLLKTVKQGIEQCMEKGRQDCIAKMVVLDDCSSNIIGFDEASKIAWSELQEKHHLRMETTETLDLEEEAKKAA